MPQQEADPWLAGGILILVLASLAAWAYLIARRVRYGYILAYEPRRPVPWGGWAALLAVVMTGLAVLMAVAPGAEPGQAADAPPDEFADVFEMVERLVSMIVFQTTVTGCFFAVVILVSGANQRDIGLPRYADEALRDIRIGIVACLAAYVPVWAIQIVVLQFRDEPEDLSEHPLIEMVVRQPSLAILLLAFVVAVIVAPIAEEVTYRLLLQGWLEKWEDLQLGWRPALRPAVNDQLPDGREPSETQAVDWPRELGMPAQDAGPDGTTMLPPMPEHTLLGNIASQAGAENEPEGPIVPPQRGLFGLPYGSVPIVLSSILFSLAHIGAGADPFPLFPLALILGYTYQRTHRIIPCIVTHFMFNLTTMVTLWRMISIRAQ